MYKFSVLCLSVFCFLLSATIIYAAGIPQPARIGGTVTISDLQLSQDNDDRYRFEVTKPDGTPIRNANGDKAEDNDGLNDDDFYLIDIPIYDETSQPNGVSPGDKVVIHIYKDGSELPVIQPENGEITVGNKGSRTQVDLESNQPPTADAGSNQTVDQGSTVTLNGTNSSDPDGWIDSYKWTQLEGPEVELSAADAEKPEFTAPNVDSGGAAIEFELTVKDNGGLSDSDQCIVNVSWKNAAPEASAGEDQSVQEGATVILDASGSSDDDPDDGIASYQWRQVSGKSITLSDPTAAQPTFVAPPVGEDALTLVFEVKVSDEIGGLKDTAQVSVTVNDNGIGGFPSDALTMTTATDANIGVNVEGGTMTALDAIGLDQIENTENMPDDLPYGLFDMEIRAETAGGTVTVTFYLPEAAASNAKWYKFSADNGWVDFSEHVSFNDSRDQVYLTLVDGGAGDQDGEENGVIVDPSGLGVSSPSGGGGGGCFLSALFR